MPLSPSAHTRSAAAAALDSTNACRRAPIRGAARAARQPPECALPNRFLDEAPGQGGHHEGDRHRDRRPRGIEAALVRQEDDDGPMPQVDAAERDADPAQGAPWNDAEQTAGFTTAATTAAVASERSRKP